MSFFSPEYYGPEIDAPPPLDKPNINPNINQTEAVNFWKVITSLFKGVKIMFKKMFVILCLGLCLLCVPTLANAETHFDLNITNSRNHPIEVVVYWVDHPHSKIVMGSLRMAVAELKTGEEWVSNHKKGIYHIEFWKEIDTWEYEKVFEFDSKFNENIYDMRY